jgi:two-component system, response regulator PdtaR
VIGVLNAPTRECMPKRKPVVLVVEDEPIIRTGAVHFVSDAGFEAIEASSADEAIRILEARPGVHLVFTDIGLPGTMDGLRLAHYIAGRWPPVKLVVASGNMVVEQSHLPAGAKFSPKPYQHSAIVKALVEMPSPPNRPSLSGA